jgi:hypothetical protein
VFHWVSRGSSVSIVSGYGLDDRAIDVRSPAETKGFLSVATVAGSGAHPASCTMGTGGPFPGGKAQSGREADHSPPSSAEVENEQELYLLSPKRLHGCRWTALALVCSIGVYFFVLVLLLFTHLWFI